MRLQIRYDLDDEALSRVHWSRLAEPGDPVAAELIRRQGPGGALREVVRSESAVLQRYRARWDQLDPVETLHRWRRTGGRFLTPADPGWPSGTGLLAAPPIGLWVQGPLDLAQGCERSVSIVGARAATDYGVDVCGELAFGLAERGFTIVSGAAFGIDGAAHRAALGAAGRTVAVVAGGIDRPYPRGHTQLLDEIATAGAVVSEVPPGSAPIRHRFIERNRVIATMTLGTVVVEAARRSGALSTARTAADHGRPVGVVPGRVTSEVSAGCHQALRDGFAVCVTSVPEVLELVGRMGEDVAPRLSGPVRSGWDELDPVARRVLEALPRGRGSPAERVSVVAGLADEDVRAALGRLALQGLAERRDNGWRRAPGALPTG
jgi:DNA processing protein